MEIEAFSWPVFAGSVKFLGCVGQRRFPKDLAFRLQPVVKVKFVLPAALFVQFISAFADWRLKIRGGIGDFNGFD